MPEIEVPEGLVYSRVLRAFLETPWAIRPEMLAVMADILAFRAKGGRLDKAEIRARIGAAQNTRMGRASSGSVAVIPLQGVIMRRADMFSEVSGATSLERFGARFREAMADD